MRLGVFGGTFDPPHVGHLLAASDAFEALELDRLLFVPANVQPLKEGGIVASAAQRLAMVRALVRDDPRFGVDPVEVERRGVSFTVDTLRQLATSYPGATLYFLVGMDVLESFDRWREPDEILRLAQLVLVRRPGASEQASATLRRIMERGVGHAPRILDGRQLDISATEIRARISRGLPLRGFVPESVAAVIAAAGLYL